MIADFTFGQQLILNVVGPMTTAIVGAAIIGGFAGLITRRAQERRAANNLRNELITKMSEAAGSLYMENANYARVKKLQPVPDGKRERVDEQYLKTRVEGEVLQHRLRAYFDGENPSDLDEKRPAVMWHSTIDLLTVLYFEVTDQITDDIYRDNSKNEGKFHSGLSVDELKVKQNVIWAYEERLAQTTQAVLTSRIRRLGAQTAEG